MKKALIVGINRYKDAPLLGCVNDATQMRELVVQRHGFRPDDVRLLVDERATQAAILERLHWLVEGARAGDVLLFHFSGHGTQVRDRDGDERLADRRDESICPVDFSWDDPLTDDKLHGVAKALAPGVNLTLVVDACQSGGLLRSALPLGFGGAGVSAGIMTGAGYRRARAYPIPQDIAHRLAGGEPIATRKEVFAPSVNLKLRDAVRALVVDRLPMAGGGLRRFGERLVSARGGQRAVLLSACKSTEYAADAYIDGGYHGAHTYGLNAVLAATPGGRVAYADLRDELRRWLRRNGYIPGQVPQLQGDPSAARTPFLEPLKGGPVARVREAVRKARRRR